MDDKPISLPIPTRQASAHRYSDLSEPQRGLAKALGRKFGPENWCHVDPDLEAGTLPRKAGWKGSLGQVGAAQSHLEKQGVEEGDIFVFWGLFRAVEFRSGEWRYSGPREHRIFGWLQVGEILRVGGDVEAALSRYPWLRGHPHTQGSSWGVNNTIYLASPSLTLRGNSVGIPGWGTMKRGRRLTRGDAPSVSHWEVPDWLNVSAGGCGMTYHPSERWSADGRLVAAARGQEFVAEPGPARMPAVEAWLLDLIKEAA